MINIRRRTLLALALVLPALLSHVPAASAQEEPRSTGMPIPRFVTLNSSKVNMRTGPSEQHPVAWVYRREGLPMKIVAEYFHWRKVVDSDGTVGWIMAQLLSNRRNVLVIGEGTADLRRNAAPEARVVAHVERGVIGTLETCNTSWCLTKIDHYEGWLPRDRLWGVLEGELID